MGFSEFLQAVLMLFIILDPLGNAPLFYTVTASMDPRARGRVIRKSIVAASAILVTLGIGGDAFLRFFGVSLDDLRIAGGAILFLYGVNGILGKSEAESIRADESVSLVPLATPLLAGPGAITVTIFINYKWGLPMMLAVVIVCSLISYAILMLGERLLRAVGRGGALLLVKIFSLLLAAIAVAMIAQGVVGYAERLRVSSAC